jgi:hypothetical protein
MGFWSGVKERLSNIGKNGPAPAPAQPADPQDEGDPQGPVLPARDRDTGPLRGRFPRWGGRRRSGEDVNLSHFERQRKLIDSFQEDRLELADKIKLQAAKLASIILPIIAVYAIGGELGQYFAGGAVFSWAASDWIKGQYLIAYAGEFALAVLTYVLGHAAAQKGEGTSHYIKLTITATIWALFLFASAAGQWYVAIAILSPSPSMKTAIAIRVAMSCSLDVAAVCLMWWRGATLAKFLAAQMKKAESIRAVNESELSIEAAQGAAERRRKEDEQYQESKRRREDVIIRLEELQGQALIGQAERLLLPGGGSSYDRNQW